MAGIPWGRYDKSDWVRVPGAARRFRNLKNPNVTISRRQFDEHYGAVSFFGTNEKKARVNAQSALQLLRPARGRKSALKLTPAEKESEINRRRVIAQEIKQQKLTERLTTKHNRLPQKITLRNFRKGTQIRKFRTDVNREQIEGLRIAAQQSRIVLSYWVGLEMVSDRDGQLKSVSLFPQREISMSFTQRDMIKAMEKAREKSYAQLTGMFIAFHLTYQAAKKNGAKIR